MRNELVGQQNELAIVAEAKRLEVEQKAPLALCEVLLDENALKQLDAHAALFERLTCSAAAGAAAAPEPRAQHSMVGGLELLIGVRHPKLIPYTAHLLKKCYDLGILMEEFILEWGLLSSELLPLSHSLSILNYPFS